MRFQSGLVLILWLSAVPAARSGSPGGPAPAPGGEKALFEELPVVEAAALHVQTLAEAPANVTVITAADIRKYGYRTLAEALASERGFYITTDHLFHYAGLRGFSIPGDFNTRFLLMINGHSMTESNHNSNAYFGHDFGLAMDLVERIEIIRGPSSALYGTNGVFATVNVVTRSPVDSPRGYVTTEMGSFGERKIQAATSVYLGKGANLLVSGSVAHNGGQDRYFPDFDTPATNHGWARGIDTERAQQGFVNLIWGNWSFLTLFSNWDKQTPISWSDSIFADPAGLVKQDRGFASASWRRSTAKGNEWRWQASYDAFRMFDRFDYDRPWGVTDLRWDDAGDWLTTELTYQFAVGKHSTWTGGLVGSTELRNRMDTFVAAPVRLNLVSVAKEDQRYAVYLQQEWNLGRRWKAYAGGRFDDSRLYSDFLSPRLALVWQASPNTVWKFVYGQPFRNPSFFEKYYEDGTTLLANNAIHKERVHAWEISVERKLRPNLTALVNAYRYDIDGLIASVPAIPYVYQYTNGPHVRSEGVEFAVDGNPLRWLEFHGNLSLQRVRLDGGRFANSPDRIAKLRFAAPILKGRWTFSSGWQYLSPRWMVTSEEVGSRNLLDCTLTSRRLHPNFDVQAGIRNTLGARYEDPVYTGVLRVHGDGRSAYLKLIWHTTE